MKVKIMSDLHLEICNLFLPKFEDDAYTVLILAGDICNFESSSSYLNFFENIKGRYRNILYVPGNHEYYGSSLVVGKNKFLEKLNKSIGQFPELSILDDSSIVIDDVLFVGATLWTDFNKGSPIDKMSAPLYMNDYRYIRSGSQFYPYQRKISPNEIQLLHHKSLEYIRSELTKNNYAKKVVITHHAPSNLSTDEKFMGHPANHSYHSDLSEFIFETKPDYWIHGHMHNTSSYQLYDTNVITNPRGYAKVKNLQQFNSLKDGQYENVKYHEIFHSENKNFDWNFTLDI